MKKILYSAYSCSPFLKSEPGVAWINIVEIVSKSKYSAIVLTRKKNVEPILRELSKPENFFLKSRLQFIGVDLPAWSLFWKKGHLMMHIYYYIWQFLAFFKAKQIVKNKDVVLAHHISFMSLRTNFVPFLNVPSIVGPVGGGQLTPQSLLPLILDRKKHFLRTLSIHLLAKSILWRIFVKKTNCFLIANKDNYWLFDNQSNIQLKQIGWPLNEMPVVKLEQCMDIMWSNRMLDWKGIGFYIEVILYLNNKYKYDKLGILFHATGKGPHFNYYKKLSQELKISNLIFHGYLNNEDFFELQSRAKIFAFTSFHETTGTSIFEAMERGMAIVALNTGGPTSILSDIPNSLVNVDSTLSTIIENYAEKINSLVMHKEYLYRSRIASFRVLASKNSLDNHVDFILNMYAQLISNN